MPDVNTTTVTQDADGYYRVRVPKALGDAMGLAGREVSWRVDAAQRLVLTPTE